MKIMSSLPPAVPVASSLADRSYKPWVVTKGKLFYTHAKLMKWDWDFQNSFDGTSAGHDPKAITVKGVQDVIRILSSHPWARNQAWFLVRSWGGVNAYLLSDPMSLRRCEGIPLETYAKECKVDPFYIRNFALGRSGEWAWNSRVLPKPGRKEMFVGKPIGILNPEEVVIDPLLLLEMQKVIGMMIPWDLTEG